MRLGDVARRIVRSLSGSARAERRGAGGQQPVRGRGTAEAPGPAQPAGGKRSTGPGRRGTATRGKGRDRIVLGYAPSDDGDADPGEAVWAWVPFEEDASQGKDRPALVIGRAGAKLVVIPLTSKDRAGRLPVGSGKWDSSGRASYADVDRFLTVEASSVRREGAALDRPIFDAVVSAARREHPELA